MEERNLSSLDRDDSDAGSSESQEESSGVEFTYVDNDPATLNDGDTQQLVEWKALMLSGAGHIDFRKQFKRQIMLATMGNEIGTPTGEYFSYKLKLQVQHDDGINVSENFHVFKERLISKGLSKQAAHLQRLHDNIGTKSLSLNKYVISQEAFEAYINSRKTIPNIEYIRPNDVDIEPYMPFDLQGRVVNYEHIRILERELDDASRLYQELDSRIKAIQAMDNKIIKSRIKDKRKLRNEKSELEKELLAFAGEHGFSFDSPREVYGYKDDLAAEITEKSKRLRSLRIETERQEKMSTRSAVMEAISDEAVNKALKGAKHAIEHNAFQDAMDQFEVLNSNIISLQSADFIDRYLHAGALYITLTDRLTHEIVKCKDNAQKNVLEKRFDEVCLKAQRLLVRAKQIILRSGKTDPLSAAIVHYHMAYVSYQLRQYGIAKYYLDNGELVLKAANMFSTKLQRDFDKLRGYIRTASNDSDIFAVKPKLKNIEGSGSPKTSQPDARMLDLIKNIQEPKAATRKQAAKADSLAAIFIGKIEKIQRECKAAKIPFFKRNAEEDLESLFTTTIATLKEGIEKLEESDIDRIKLFMKLGRVYVLKEAYPQAVEAYKQACELQLLLVEDSEEELREVVNGLNYAIRMREQVPFRTNLDRLTMSPEQKDFVEEFEHCFYRSLIVIKDKLDGVDLRKDLPDLAGEISKGVVQAISPKSVSANGVSVELQFSEGINNLITALQTQHRANKSYYQHNVNRVFEGKTGIATMFVAEFLKSYGPKVDKLTGDGIRDVARFTVQRLFEYFGDARYMAFLEFENDKSMSREMWRSMKDVRSEHRLHQKDGHSISVKNFFNMASKAPGRQDSKSPKVNRDHSTAYPIGSTMSGG